MTVMAKTENALAKRSPSIFSRRNWVDLTGLEAVFPGSQIPAFPPCLLYARSLVGGLPPTCY